MAIKEAPFRPKDKKSAVDVVNTGLGVAKTVGGIASDANSLFSSSDGGSNLADSAIGRRAGLGVDMDFTKYTKPVDAMTKRMRGY